MVKLYCDSVNGDDANDGLSWATAVKTLTQLTTVLQALTSTERTYMELYLSGYFSDEKLVVTAGDYDSDAAYQISIIGINGCVIDNYGLSNDCLYLDGNSSSGYVVGYHIKGLTIINDLTDYTNRAIDCDFSYFGNSVYIEDCHIEGFAYWGRSYLKQIRNTAFKNFSLIDELNGQTSSQNATFKLCENCTFDNVSFYYSSAFQPFYIRLFSEGILSKYQIWFSTNRVYVENNIYLDSDIVIGLDDNGLYPYPFDNSSRYFISNNNFDNCSFGFVQTDGSLMPMPLYTGTVASCSTLTELQAKMTADGVTFASNWGDNETFLDSALDGYLHPTDKSLYLDNLHRGAKTFSKVVDYLQFTALQNGHINNGYLQRSATGVDGVFVSSAQELDQPETPHSLQLQFTCTDTEGEIPTPIIDGTVRRIGVEIMWSSTKTAAELEAEPEPWYVAYTGLRDDTILFDWLHSRIKSFKVRVTLKDEGATPLVDSFRVYAVELLTRDGIIEEATNISLNQYNDAEQEYSVRKMSNIMLVGSTVYGKIHVMDSDGGAIVGVTVTVTDSNGTVSEVVTDSEGKASFDYNINTDNTLLIQHQDYQNTSVVINENTLRQFNIDVEMKRKVRTFYHQGREVVNLRPYDPMNTDLY